MNFVVIAVLNGSISDVAARRVDLRHHQHQHRCGCDVLAHPQALLQRDRRVPLRHAQRAGELAEQFLQRAERAQPAAEHAAPDQHHRDERVAGDDDHQRLGKVETNPGVIERRPHIVHDIDDRELHAGGPAEPDQNNQQESSAHEPVGDARARQRRLEDEDQSEHRQEHGQNRNVDPRVAPGLDPGGDGRQQLQLRLRLRQCPAPAAAPAGSCGCGCGMTARRAGLNRDLEDMGVRDLVVEPERDRQRWSAGAIDQNFQSPRLQRDRSRTLAGSANSPVTCWPWMGVA